MTLLPKEGGWTVPEDAGLWWDELMNVQAPAEQRSPSSEGLSAVRNEGSDTP
jgi:hypothetical protein